MTARVLVVDDILPNVKLLEAKLMAEYYEVVTALNGPEALKRVAEDNPDVVLLDVMMPGMDGFEVCRLIKENPKTAHVPVVMVTALTDVEDRVRGAGLLPRRLVTLLSQAARAAAGVAHGAPAS